MSEPKMADVPALIDTREQCPLTLAMPLATRGKVEAGDYSIKGYERFVGLERKSLIDLCGTVGGGRERFTREMERLRAVPYRAIVIEDSLSNLLHRMPKESSMHPNAVLGALAAWSWRYSLPVWFAGNPTDAATLVERLLYVAYKDLLEPWEWRIQREEAARIQREQRRKDQLAEENL